MKLRSPEDRAALRAAIEALPVHPIGGHEWECDDCHYHFSDHAPCRYCSGPVEDEGYFDSRGVACDHGALLSRRAVLEILQRGS